MKRAQKAKLLTELLSGKPHSLLHAYQCREQDPAKMTTQQLLAEYEWIRQKEYRATGVMPPSLPDYSAMTVDELYAIRDAKRGLQR